MRTWLDGRRRRARVSGAPVDEAPTPDPDPEARAGARQLGGRLASALDGLPADQRAAVWLVDVEQLTFAEAAEALGVAPGTAASRVARGRAALRLSLADVVEFRRTR